MYKEILKELFYDYYHFLVLPLPSKKNQDIFLKTFILVNTNECKLNAKL